MPQPDHWLHWRRIVPAGCVGLLVFAWLSISLWNIQRSGTTIALAGAGPGQPSPQTLFVFPRVTVADLNAIAAGESHDIELCDSMLQRAIDWLEQPPGRDLLWIAFTDPAGMRTDVRAIGWPEPWWSSAETRGYGDVFDRVVLKAPEPIMRPSPTIAPRRIWSRGTISTLTFGAAGFTSQEAVSLPMIAYSAAILIVAWYAGVAIGVLIRTAAGMIRRCPAGPRKSWPRICGCLALLSVFIIMGLKSWPKESTYARPNFTLTNARTISTGGSATATIPADATAQVDLDALAIRRWSQQPDGEKKLAAFLSDVADLHRASPDDCLAFAFEQETSRTATRVHFGWPMMVAFWEELTRSFGSGGAAIPAIWKPGPTKFRLHGHWLSGVLGTTAPTDRRHSLMLDMTTLAVGVLVVWTVWMAAGVLCWLLACRRTRRYVRTGRCVECGYPLRVNPG